MYSHCLIPSRITTSHCRKKPFPGSLTDSHRFTHNSSSELFAFKGNPARLPSASTVPAFISTWPTLPLDLTAASFLSPSAVSIQQRPGEELDENDDSNVNSVLAVADDNGGIHPFLDGSFPLGVIDVGKECTITSLYKGDNTRYFFHPASLPNATSTTQLSPTELSIPFLRDRVARDVARSSTAARELAWYTFRVVKEMRAAWFGSDTQQGAREAGPKWLRALEQRQKKFGSEWDSPFIHASSFTTPEQRTNDTLFWT